MSGLMHQYVGLDQSDHQSEQIFSNFRINKNQPSLTKIIHDQPSKSKKNPDSPRYTKINHD